MTYAEIKAVFFASKEGILDEKALVLREVDADLLFYDCPCGGEDHFATRSMIEEGFSRFPSEVLNCYEQGKQWLIRPRNIVAEIRQEEERYIKLLERAPAIVKKVIAKRGESDETFRFLASTHGIDRETAESIICGQPRA